MADYTARHKNPTPVMVMISITLTIGYSGAFGMLSDNKEFGRQYASRPEQIKQTHELHQSNQLIDLYGGDWYGKGCDKYKCKGAK